VLEFEAEAGKSADSGSLLDLLTDGLVTSICESVVERKLQRVPFF
jgi:hypothetical protein